MSAEVKCSSPTCRNTLHVIWGQQWGSQVVEEQTLRDAHWTPCPEVEDAWLCDRCSL